MGWIEGAAEDPNAHWLGRWRGCGRGRRRRGPALLSDLAVVGIRLSHRVAEVARVFSVLDLPIRLEEPEVGVARLGRVRMEPDHILEVDDRRVIRFPFQVEIARVVVLFGEPLVQPIELRARGGSEGRVRIARKERLVRGNRVASVSRIELRATPLLLVGLAREEQRVVDERVLRKRIDEPVVGRGGEQVLTQLVVRLRQVVEGQR